MRRVEVDRLDELREHLPLRELRIDRDVDRQPARRRRDRQVEPAERRRREVGRHRVGLLPDPGRPAGARRRRDEDAVRQRRQALRHGDGEVERRLVARVVVARIPAGRALRLVDDEGAVVGGDPALDRLVRVDDHLRDAAVVDGDAEGRAAPDPGLRRDHELLAVARKRGGDAVHRQLRDLEAAQVEIEAGEILRRRRGDDGLAVEHVGARVVRELEVVVGDVVAAVARVREERIAET